MPCNPYPADRIILHCGVRAPDFNFLIQWIWQADSSSELIELDPTDLNVMISTVTPSSFNGFRSRLSVTNLMNRAGMFWCRARLSNGTRLEDSNKLTLYSQNGYENDNDCGNEPLSEQSSTGRCINTAFSVAETPPLFAMGQTTPPTVLAGNQTTPSSPDGLGSALYTVIAVILVFCLVIVMLSVTIVLLYRRRKCGRGDIKTAGECVENSLCACMFKMRPRLCRCIEADVFSHTNKHTAFHQEALYSVMLPSMASNRGIDKS